MINLIIIYTSKFHNQENTEFENLLSVLTKA